MLIKIRKGLNLFIQGESSQPIQATKSVCHVALMGDDYIGLKAKLLVKQGDIVKRGQNLFIDKKTQVNYTSPASGYVSKIEFGQKHCLKSLVISVNGDQQETFIAYTDQQIESLSTAEVKNNLLSSGLWTALRTRPFSKIPKPESIPHSIFVTAMDTNPYAVNPAVVLSEYAADFKRGLKILSKLANVPIIICQSENLSLEIPKTDSFKIATFTGPHPAGLPGTHIHFIDPVGSDKTVWHIHYQEVIAMGKLFASGHLWTERIISIAGDSVKNPKIIRASLGAALDNLFEAELLKDESIAEGHRIVSGSVLSGRQPASNKRFLGRYHYQASVVKKEKPPVKKNWLDEFFTPTQHYTAPFIPTDNFERVMPLDILPSPLLKALLHHDLETAVELGALELDEEDLALCSYICPSHLDYGAALRTALSKIEAETV